MVLYSYILHCHIAQINPRGFALFQLQREFSFIVITLHTCLIADTEPQVEGDDPGHRPRHCLHGEGAFVVVQQGDEGGHIRKPASNTSAKMSYISAKVTCYSLWSLRTHLKAVQIIFKTPWNRGWVKSVLSPVFHQLQGVKITLIKLQCSQFFMFIPNNI